ncbi:MAG: response regulator transcription factor [Paludibacteraceae bacterium]|nr:response regulator transcription factor [Paludibacteraceae bacterium]
MMKIKVLAIDDEPLALQQLVTYINKVPFLELAAQFQSAVEARAFLEQDNADAIFCDINMPDLNGMDFIKSLAAPPLIVFTTAYSEYAVEGFRVNAVDYLLKPFSLQDFQRAANKLLTQLSALTSHISPLPSDLSPLTSNLSPLPPDYVFLKTDYRVIKVNIADIRYIEAMSEYLKVWREGETKPIITLLSMKKIEESLPNYFMRIHRSYIINLKKITEVNKNRVFLSEDTSIPIGDLYKEAFQAFIDSKYLSK